MAAMEDTVKKVGAEEMAAMVATVIQAKGAMVAMGEMADS